MPVLWWMDLAWLSWRTTHVSFEFCALRWFDWPLNDFELLNDLSPGLVLFGLEALVAFSERFQELCSECRFLTNVSLPSNTNVDWLTSIFIVFLLISGRLMTFEDMFVSIRFTSFYIVLWSLFKRCCAAGAFVIPSFCSAVSRVISRLAVSGIILTSIDIYWMRPACFISFSLSFICRFGL